MAADKSLLAELWDFIKARKNYWLVPAVVLLIIIGLLLIILQSGIISTAVYAFI